MREGYDRDLSASREQQILRLLGAKGIARVSELSGPLGVSDSTLRRDLSRMAERGVIRRVRGGAALPELEEEQVVGAFGRRLEVQREEKIRIGLAAAKLVNDGDVILLNGGSTTYQVARQLGGKQIRLITTSIYIAAVLAKHPLIELLVTGGLVQGPYGDVIGPQTADALSQMRVQKLFMGADGLDASGLYCRNPVIAETDRLTLEAAQDEVIVVTDHTKLGRAGLVQLAGLSRITRVVTGREAARQHIEFLEAAGVEVLVA